MDFNIFKKNTAGDKVDQNKSPLSKYPGSMSKSVPKSNPRNIYSLFTNEFAELDLNRIKFYIEASRKGLNFWKSLFFEYIRREDLQLGGVCQTRKLAVIGKLRGAMNNGGVEGLIQGGDNLTRSYLVSCFENINLPNFLSDIVESQIQGVTIFEKNFGVSNGRIVLESINVIPNHLVMYHDIEDEYYILDIRENDSFFLRTLSSNSLSDRINLEPIVKVHLDKRKLFEVHSFDGNSQNGFQNGCVDSLIIAYYFKRFGISDWATFLELYATPPRVGKYDPLAATPEDIKALETGVRDFASNSWAVISKNTDLEFPTAQGKRESSDIYKDYITFFNESIAIRVLGQTLTTNVGDTGSYAAANIHNTVREDILNSDIMLIEESLNRLSRELIDMNFSGVSEYPLIRFPETRGLADKKTLSEILSNLRSSGYTPDIEVLRDEFGFRLEKEVMNNAAMAAKGLPTGESGSSSGDGGVRDKSIDELLKSLI